MLSVGVVGCGYVADFYALCLRTCRRQVELAAACDLDRARAESFTAAYGGRTCATIEDLLADPRIDTVLNLTPPGAHADVTRLALHAGKHVYSEKPLATTIRDGERLIGLAASRGLALGAAPAVHRSPAARRIRRRIRSRALGRITHLYCDLDDGPVHRWKPEEWRSPRGVRWPLEDEFGLGPVLHHAPYAAAWAIHVAGPVARIKGFTTTTVARKNEIAAGPDLCLAIFEHASGVLTRVTVGALARRRRSLTVVGDDGELQLDDMWCVDGPLREADGSVSPAGAGWPYKSTHRLNFAQGLRDLACCLRHDPREGARRFTAAYGALSLHVLEITLAVSQPGAIDCELTLGVPSLRAD